MTVKGLREAVLHESTHCNVSRADVPVTIHTPSHFHTCYIYQFSSSAFASSSVNTTQFCLPINPFIVPACKISGLKHACKQYISRSYFVFLMLRILMKILSHAGVKKKRLKVSNFVLLLVVFKRHHDSEGVSPAPNECICVTA